MKRLYCFFLMSVILLSCSKNVEEIPDVNCDTDPEVHEINWMMNVSVQNASVILRPGDTVRWIWAEDNMPHDVSSTEPNAPTDFGSAILTGIGNVYEYTFTEAVTFNYFCSVHPTTMFGTITVISCD